MFILPPQIIDLLLKHPAIKKRLEKAVSDFVDGFTKTPPTQEERIRALATIADALKEPAFTQTLTSLQYFELLLNVLSQAVHLKGRPLVLKDFYIPGYCFYFPAPPDNPEVVPGNFPRVDAGTARQIQAPAPKPYYFYAVPVKGSDAAVVKKLRDNVATPAGSADVGVWQKVLAAATGVDENDIVAIQMIGRKPATTEVIFCNLQDVTGESDLMVKPNPDTRSNIAAEVASFLAKPIY